MEEGMLGMVRELVKSAKHLALYHSQDAGELGDMARRVLEVSGKLALDVEGAMGPKPVSGGGPAMVAGMGGGVAGRVGGMSMGM